MVPRLHLLGQLQVRFTRIDTAFPGPLLYYIFLQPFLLTIHLSFVIDPSARCLMVIVNLRHLGNWQIERMALAIRHARGVACVVLMECHEGSEVTHAGCFLDIHHVVLW